MSDTKKDQAGNQSSPSSSQSTTGRHMKPTSGFKKGKHRGKRNGSSGPMKKTQTPQFEYVSACCSLPARKPVCGRKENQENPESHKMKEVTKGLGHWRCTACGKITKVTPRKTTMPAPVPVEVPNDAAV